MVCVKFLLEESVGSPIREIRLRNHKKSDLSPQTSNRKFCEVKRVVEMDLYVFSLFYSLLEDSPAYRGAVLRNFKFSPEVGFRLRPPSRLPIDYKSNEIVSKTCIERRDLEHAMSWLSTFGGAFSALGDGMEHCALVAGKISIQQLQIAVHLGDHFTVIRCKLYCALSLIQLGKFSAAREIIQAQYDAARSGPVIDGKVISMCKGIWAKLRYDRQQKKGNNRRRVN